jgi:hypothetical protein
MRTLSFVVVLMTLAPAAPAAAQFPPDSLVNLKVFPKTTTPRALVDEMRGFTNALGVRCQYCHVGEEGRPLSEFDFPKDEKRPKEVARVMLRMVNEINEKQLADIPERERPWVRVTCVTCHRGLTKPRMLEDVLADEYATGGVPAATAKYRELREEYGGTWSYDFSERPLRVLAERIQRLRRLDDAIAIQLLNAEIFPQSAGIQVSIGDLYLAKGDTANAIARLENALTLNPNAQQLQRRLDQLRRR